MLLALVIVVPIPTMAQVGVSVSIGLPPPIAFAEPPAVIVLPDAPDVYVVPGIDVDLFFWNGWWWRPWQGGWYRSRYYNRGWGYYSNVPSFYYDVDPGWRGYYRDRNWYGHPWHYERIDHQRLQRNWQTWHNNRHWERQQTWGVQNYQPRPQQQRQELRQQRQQQYQQRPEVQQHQQQRRQQQRQPQTQKPQGQQQRQPQVQQPRQQLKDESSTTSETIRQTSETSSAAKTTTSEESSAAKTTTSGESSAVRTSSLRGKFTQQQHSQPQGKPEGGQGEHRK